MTNPFIYIAIVPVRIYQKLISPLLGPTCRYQPTCSAYMIDALKEWGLIIGLYIGIRRILRCHPWASSGYDPVPTKKDKNAKATEKK